MQFYGHMATLDRHNGHTQSMGGHHIKLNRRRILSLGGLQGVFDVKAVVMTTWDRRWRPERILVVSSGDAG